MKIALAIGSATVGLALTACGSTATTTPQSSGSTIAVNQTSQTSNADRTVYGYHCDAGDGMLPDDGTLTLRGGTWFAKKTKPSSSIELAVGTDINNLVMPSRCHVVK